MKFAPLAALALLASPVAAQTSEPEMPVTQAEQSPTIEQRAEDVVRLLNGQAEASAIFTEGFLAAVPPAQLEGLVKQLTGQFGAAVGVESVTPPTGTRAALAIRMERAIAKGGIAIDPAQGGKISELLFQTFEPIGDSPAKIKADLEALPGDVSAFFGPVDGAADTLSLQPEEQMPLGSTMKLYVLAALGREIARGKRAWSDIVTLDAKSFPSGQMQDWPTGAPVTLHTLASLMISVSDNTATDALITLLGREAVLAVLADSGHADPARNAPWMTTRDLFLLKGGNPDRLATYQKAATDVRSQILAGIEAKPVASADIQRAFSGGPIAIDVEWFASARDLAKLVQLMRRQCDPQVFEIMAISPAVPSNIRDKWEYIGYKGGSEPGVLNLTWVLRDAQGGDRLLTLSWANSKSNLNKTRLDLIAQRILSLPQ
ncbi:MAG: serine hydrolase [Pseudomonadota bacterium]